ncbi:Hypothetical predicted protein [Paramuricea clavata]|uniref:Uncharacterized protein n=1 Tax=Paramuricea clavata TaxID=317549 RepID=A0A6S7HTK5_PARCT|nr:Hypothetical predicted protein [Paramuricea clavata]
MTMVDSCRSRSPLRGTGYVLFLCTHPTRTRRATPFFKNLPDYIDLAVPTFFCGDFNAVLNPDIDRRHHPSYAGPSQGAMACESVAALQSLLSATHTFPVWRMRNPTERIFSWDHALEKKHRAKQAIPSICDPDTGLIHNDPFKILATWRSYYQRLFTAEECDRSEQDIMLDRLTRRLSKSEVQSCEGELSEQECYAALHDLVRVLNLAYTQGQLSTSQRRGIIIVLYKKDDRLETKNYRPISLLNVDYKIATRVIIGSIVGYDQTCGIPDCTISENLMLIRDLIEYADRADVPLAILPLDQKKAFDRVHWSFLHRILFTFGFAASFRQWSNLFYTNIESAVVINGWTSFFQPSRGVRQG